MAGEWETVVPAKADGWETVVPAGKKTKYKPSADTQYSAEGTPLVSDIPEGEVPAWAQKTADVLTDIAGAPVRAAMSVAKPISAVAEMLGYGEPAKAVLAMDKGIKSQTGPISTGASILGDVAGFGAAGKAAQMGLGALKQVPKIAEIGQAISQVAPKFLTTPGAASTIAKGMGIGAATGVMEPVGKAAGEEGYLEEKAGQAGMGAVLGPAAQALGYGASRVLSPQLQRLKDLAAQGIDVDQFLKKATFGQTMGGAAQTAENVIKSLPFSGMKPLALAGEENLQNLAYQKAQQMAKAARGERGAAADELTNLVRQEKFDLGQAQKAAAQKLDADLAASAEALAAKHTESFSRPLINDALKPLGKELPAGVTGNAAIDEAAKQISNAFEEGLDQMKRVPIDKKGIAALVESKGAKLGDYAGEFESEANRLVDLMGRKTYIPSREWQAEYQALNEASYKARMSPDIKERNYGQALRDLRDVWFKNVETAPNAEKYLAANAAHSALQVPQKAASYVSAVADRGGQFNPREFLNAIKADTTEKQFARGIGKNQEAAVKAYQDQVNELKQLKQQYKTSKDQLRQTHDLERKQLSEKHTALGRTAAEKKADINEARQLAQRNLNQFTGDIVKEGRPGYFMNRLGYLLAASPFISSIYHGVQAGAPAAAIAGGLSGSILPSVGMAVAPGLTSRLLYSNPKAQEILKNLATKRTPEMIAAGKKLQGQLGSTVPFVGSAVLNPTFNTPPEEEYATGGLVHLAPGGPAVKKYSSTVDEYQYEPLSIYRADVKGKYKGPDRMETRPTEIDKLVLQDYVKAMRAGEEFGVPQLSPQQIAKMALIEGRGDLGFNNLNYNNKQAYNAANMLGKYGHPDTAAGFAGALLDKTQLAQRKGIPFEHAWNGLGKSKYKQTGADYAKKYEGIDYAVEHPKNAPLMQVINEAYQFQTPKPAPSPLESVDAMGAYIPRFDEGGQAKAYVGYPHINKNRKIGSGTGFLDALVGAPASHENVLNPSDASYMRGYEKGEPYGLAAAMLPFGGMTKSVGKAAELAAPAINKSLLHELRNEIEQQGGSLAAKRFDRAADLVPGLERQYQPETLRNAFIGDNRNMFMVMNPADFEKYAAPIPAEMKKSTSPNYRIGRPGPGQNYTHMPSGTYDDYIQYLQQFVKPGGGGFEGRPSLEIGKREGFIFPNIQGHEGRHRTEALSRLGDKSTLVTLWPRSDFNDLPRRSQPEFLEAFLDRIGGNKPMVMPQESPGLKRGLIDLPEIFKKGGLATLKKK